MDAERLNWVCRSLYVPAVCDVLDALGRRAQAMHQRLRPLDPEHCTFAGRAENGAMDGDRLRGGRRSVRLGDPAGRFAPARRRCRSFHRPRRHERALGRVDEYRRSGRGAVGCICDSNIRDCRKILALGFPVFYAGIRPLDSLGRGRVMAFDVPVRCGEVLVYAGELVFADFDGVVVVPRDLEEEVLDRAAEKAGRESASRKELLEGKSLQEVYSKYGVL